MVSNINLSKSLIGTHNDIPVKIEANSIFKIGITLMLKGIPPIFFTKTMNKTMA